MKKRRRGKLNGVKLIVYDFDGVLTDNKVVLREDGLESVVVNRADGMAIGMIKGMGIKQLILTSETNKIAEVRAKKLDISVNTSVRDKKKALADYCGQEHIAHKSVVYIGNDLNDCEVMRSVGYPVCPSDASDEIKKIAMVVLRTAGGAGVIRELMGYLQARK